tara:strand:+ start:8673 stop:9299 length:627 start_codon:yes stop_codon:yes gene_type:complete
MKKVYYPKIHETTVIILHGLNQNVYEIDDMINLINCDNIKWVILQSKNNSWYQYYTQRDNHNRHDKINYNQFKSSCDYLIKTINHELKYTSPSNLYLIGISQGGTICINVAINLKYTLGGIICIDTIFLSDYMSDISFLQQTFYALISSKDIIYNPNFQIICYDFIRFLGNKIHITKRNKHHCEDKIEICNYICNILQKNKLLKNLNV